MVDRAGRQVGAHADVARPHRVLADIVEAIAADRARRIGARIGQAVVFLSLTPAESGPGADAVGQVELAAHGAEQLLLVGVGPALGEVLVGGGRVRDGGSRRHAGAGRVDPVILPAQIGRKPGAIASAVQSKADDPQLAGLVLDGAFARTAGDIQARAPFAFVAETAS